MLLNIIPIDFLKIKMQLIYHRFDVSCKQSITLNGIICKIYIDPLLFNKITLVSISLFYAVFFKLNNNLLANSGKSPSASVYSIKTKEPFAIKEYKIIKNQ